MTNEKRAIEETIAYFKNLSDTLEMCARATDDELKRERYSAKAEVYRVAAFELEHKAL